MSRKRVEDALLLDGDPRWYKDAILYEAHVRAFFDSDGDGIGDFAGLTLKLDYLQDLGVTAIWLLPFYPSPLRDDGYDIAGYTDIHSSYGTLADFRTFLREAHRHGLRVITELVLNHTSDQHPWFQRARRAAAGSSSRDFYVWSDTPDRYRDARIIFQDFETSNWSWDPVAKAYYWHRFYAHQPDLNFDNPEVLKKLFQVVNFWMSIGVDGLRLDAIPYLYEREGTNCENLPETHALLKELRNHVDRNFKNRMFLAEANQWPEDAVSYFGEGDECHMAFHFPLMPRMFMAVRMEDRFPIIDILEQTPAIPESAQWALFLRNHDELTLEMVTDEERDYMYRVYAGDPQARINLGIRRRLAPLLRGDRRKIELMNGLLLSLPGTPVIYYGDEIGMGDNIYLGDRNGVRTPMQWSADRNAGFSRAPSQRLFLPLITEPDYHFEAVNVEAEENNPSSLLWWTKRIIALRKRFRAFGRGSLEFLYPENRKVLAFVRRHEDETILVVANLSRFTQFVELDLSGFIGMIPVEVFGRTEFPPIGPSPYVLTLGPHNFFWFLLGPQRSEEAHRTAGEAHAETPVVSLAGGWLAAFRGQGRVALDRLLPEHVAGRRWFGGKARHMKSAALLEAVPVSLEDLKACLALIRVEYTDGEAETYQLPLGVAGGLEASVLRREYPQSVVAELRFRQRASGDPEDGLLFDALYDGAFAMELLDAMAHRRRWKAALGEIAASKTKVFRDLFRAGEELPPSVLKAEQSNTSVIYGDRLILKVFRRPEEGVNPDLEIGAFLTERTGFAHVPPVAGALEYRRRKGEPMTLAILQGFVPNQGDCWQFTLDALGRYFERVLSRRAEIPVPQVPAGSALDLANAPAPPLVAEMIGTYLPFVELLGRRTAELHVALASEREDPRFSPEPFTRLYQRGLYQSLRTAAGQEFQLLRKRLRSLPPEAQAEASRVLELEETLQRKYRKLLDARIDAARIRVHGDYHLGQVLFTGKDFVIIDFEGEPAKSLTARRLKRSALIDVAGMLRSFDYASHAALGKGGVVRAEDLEALGPWARFWNQWVASAFLKSYLEAAAGSVFLPSDPEGLRILLEALVLEKAVYEIGYELNNRPAWIRVPVAGITDLLQPARGPGGPTDKGVTYE
jgi:maltose alpha-D-glucosyltransferase / alpha-amylase